MKILKAGQVELKAAETILQDVSGILDGQERYAIAEIAWPGFSNKPEASFALAWTKDSILLKYFIREKEIRIRHLTSNAPVYEDSCVEFFIAFDEDPAYYNLEFNAIGTCLFAYGENRESRQLIGADMISRIRSLTTIHCLNDKGETLVNWELTLILPLEIFVHHRISTLRNRKVRGNFYKCGDGLPHPHYLSWNPVFAPAPDFHLPAYFGSIHFC